MKPYRTFLEVEFPSLTGVIRFLMNAWKQVEDMRKMKFPSLTGVIHFLIAGIRAIKTVAQTFPSLTGVIRFLMNSLFR